MTSIAAWKVSPAFVLIALQRSGPLRQQCLNSQMITRPFLPKPKEEIIKSLQSLIAKLTEDIKFLTHDTVTHDTVSKPMEHQPRPPKPF